MKKMIVLVTLALLFIPLLAQNQEIDLKRINFPMAYIQAGKEYPAGNYWVFLITRDGQSFFAVHNAQKELLFEELAVVKEVASGSSRPVFRVKKEFLKNREYFRIMVITPVQRRMGYFLVKK